MNTSDSPFQPLTQALPEASAASPPGGNPLESNDLSAILNHLYHDGDLGAAMGPGGTIPLVDRTPSPDHPETTLDRIGLPQAVDPAIGFGGVGMNQPVFPALFQAIPDPDFLASPPVIRYGTQPTTPTADWSKGPAPTGSFKPPVEIPLAMPGLPTALVSASGSPVTPNALPGNEGVSDGVGFYPSAESAGLHVPTDAPQPRAESPAHVVPVSTNAPNSPPLRSDLISDPLGAPRISTGVPLASGAEETDGMTPDADASGFRSIPLPLGSPYFLHQQDSGKNQGIVGAGESILPFLPPIPGLMPGVDTLLSPMKTGIPVAPSQISVGRYFLLDQSTPQPAEQQPEPGFDLTGVRADFPILHQKVNGKPLVWLDNAATSQKPRAVIEAVKQYYETINSNVHRGAHTLAARATDAYEGAREKVQRFIGAASPEEIVFTRGTTEGINLVANSFGRAFLQPGDEVILTTLEHHSNIVPWLMLRDSLGIKIKVAPVDDNGDLILAEFAKLFGPRTKLAAFTHVSNALGAVMPVQEMTAVAHAAGVKVLIDGAQSTPHFRINVRAIDADLYVFSGHKVFAPTGVGILYGKKSLLDSMPPWQGGGSMIDKVTFEDVTYNKVPYKFEAGTPIIGSAVGLGAAFDYLERIGFDRAAAYESSLMAYAQRRLGSISGVRLIGNPRHRAGSISLIVEGIETEKVGKFLDREGIAVRAGHHCAQPALARFGLQASVRPSLAFYNTVGEIDQLVEAILKAQRELK